MFARLATDLAIRSKKRLRVINFKAEQEQK